MKNPALLFLTLTLAASLSQQAYANEDEQSDLGDRFRSVFQSGAERIEEAWSGAVRTEQKIQEDITRAGERSLREAQRLKQQSERQAKAGLKRSEAAMRRGLNEAREFGQRTKLMAENRLEKALDAAEEGVDTVKARGSYGFGKAKTETERFLDQIGRVPSYLTVQKKGEALSFFFCQGSTPCEKLNSRSFVKSEIEFCARRVSDQDDSPSALVTLQRAVADPSFSPSHEIRSAQSENRYYATHYSQEAFANFLKDCRVRLEKSATAKRSSKPKARAVEPQQNEIHHGEKSVDEPATRFENDAIAPAEPARPNEQSEEIDTVLEI